MQYIPSKPNPSGAYPGPRSNPEPDAYLLTDEQAQMAVEYNGFVIITQDGAGTVTVKPNLELWEAWKAEEAAKPAQPDSESGDPISWATLASAIREGVNEV